MDESGNIMILATPISSWGREEYTPLFGLDGYVPQGMVLWVLSLSFSMIIQRILKLSLSAPPPPHPTMGLFPAYDTPLSTPMLGFH